MYHNEDDFWNDYYDAQDAAEKEAQRIAESSADLWDFESDAEREQYIAEEFRAEFARLMAENYRYFRECKKGR